MKFWDELLWGSKNEKTEKYEENNSCSQFYTNHLCNAITVLKYFGSENSAELVTIKLYWVGCSIVENEEWTLVKNED